MIPLVLQTIADVSSYTAPDGIKPWMECFFFLIAATGAAVWLYNQVREAQGKNDPQKIPQPAEVQIGHAVEVKEKTRFARWEELCNLEERFEGFRLEHIAWNLRIEKKLDDDKTQILNESRAREESLRKHMDEVGYRLTEKVGQLMGLSEKS